MNHKQTLIAASIVAALLAGCGNDNAENTGASGSTQPTPPLTHLPAAQVAVADLVDIQPGYNIAVSFDPEVGQFSALHKQVNDFAQQQVEQFRKSHAAQSAKAQRGADKPTLSLSMTSVANTPTFAAVAANGSASANGASQLIMSRWVYLPHTQQVVTAQQMFPGNQLQGLLSAAGASGQLVGMEPVADAAGKISEIRFVYLLPDSANADDAVNKVILSSDKLRAAMDPKYRELLGKSPD